MARAELVQGIVVAEISALQRFAMTDNAKPVRVPSLSFLANKPEHLDHASKHCVYSRIAQPIDRTGCSTNNAEGHTTSASVLRPMSYPHPRHGQTQPRRTMPDVAYMRYPEWVLHAFSWHKTGTPH